MVCARLGEFPGRGTEARVLLAQEIVKSVKRMGMLEELEEVGVISGGAFCWSYCLERAQILF